MANFRLLGNTLIDFSQVRSVEATDTGFFEVTYNNGDHKLFPCANPAQVLRDSFAEFERVDDERFPLKVAQADEAVQ